MWPCICNTMCWYCWNASNTNRIWKDVKKWSCLRALNVHTYRDMCLTSAFKYYSLLYLIEYLNILEVWKSRSSSFILHERYIWTLKLQIVYPLYRDREKY